MKLSAQVVPYSSLVGSGVALVDGEGARRFLVCFTGLAHGCGPRQSEALAAALAARINASPLEVPDA